MTDIYPHRVALLAKYKGVSAEQVREALDRFMAERGLTSADTMLLIGDGDDVSRAALKWAEEKQMGYFAVKPDWTNLGAEGALVKTNAKGQYNATAWMGRDRKLIELATDVIVFWDGTDEWLGKMMDEATANGKKVAVEWVGEGGR